MPKIKDLGINVIPETMRPPEIGAGGTCITPTCGCTVITIGPAAPCGCTVITLAGAEAAHPSLMTICLPWVTCPTACGCTHVTNPCFGCTLAPTVPCATHTITACPNYSVVCPGITAACTAASQTITITPTTPVLQQGGLTRESIAQLKQQLQEQIAQLDEAAKNLGPKTAEDIDARVNQLKAELDELTKRRKDVK